MTIIDREQQILRIKKASFQSELEEQLELHLRKQVVLAVQTAIEAALVEEAIADVAGMHPQPRRSGYFQRTLDTQYGRIDRLAVPKLRHSNKERLWRILERYQRSLRGLLDFAGYLYIMGLSLRDLQEALYFLLGNVLSRTAVNRVTLKVQERMEVQRQAPITKTPPILIVDGVWVNIQYTLNEFKIDQAGHKRRQRQAQERVILVAMAVWPNGFYHILHYEIAEVEGEQAWMTFFDHLIARGLNPQAVKLVVSDGSKGLLAAMAQCLPQAQQQRCITHKVRGMKPYLTYAQLPDRDDLGQALTKSAAKKQRWQAIKRNAYDIFDAPTIGEAQQRLDAFTIKWKPLEPDAVHAFRWGIKRTFTFYNFDKELFVHIRTTNHLERFFREFRNRADEIGAFPNETSCLTLFSLVMVRDHAKHDRLQVAKT
jgi:transposase-like protein